jgi:uncharacterized protein DUF1275
VVSRATAGLLLLTAVAGSTDAISYLGLGKVFPANMTGNTVLLAIGTTTGDYAAASRSAVALAGFICGATVTAFATARADTQEILVPDLAGELALLAAAFGLWLSVGDPPGPAARYCLIALVSLAMGTQSATVTKLDVGVSTTYITEPGRRSAAASAAGCAGQPASRIPADQGSNPPTGTRVDHLPRYRTGSRRHHPMGVRRDRRQHPVRLARNRAEHDGAIAYEGVER